MKSPDIEPQLPLIQDADLKNKVVLVRVDEQVDGITHRVIAVSYTGIGSPTVGAVMGE